MAADTALSVRVTGTNNKQSRTGELRVRHFDQGTRTRRALKALAFCWGMACVTVLLPIVHFVLVPGFLIAGPVVAYLRFNQQSMSLGGSSPCPYCDDTLEIEKGKLSWPLEDSCGKCRKPVTIEPV